MLLLIIFLSNIALAASPENAVTYYQKVIDYKNTKETRLLSTHEKEYFKAFQRDINATESPYKLKKELFEKLKMDKRGYQTFSDYITGKSTVYNQALSQKERLQEDAVIMELKKGTISTQLDAYFYAHPKDFSKLITTAIEDLINNGLPLVEKELVVDNIPTDTIDVKRKINERKRNKLRREQEAKLVLERNAQEKLREEKEKAQKRQAEAKIKAEKAKEKAKIDAKLKAAIRDLS